CMTQHEPANNDGLLSMWRGYGERGNGAAIVFNTSFIKAKGDSPLVITRVRYASRDQRLTWMQSKLAEACALLEPAVIPDESLHVVAHYLLHLVKYFALTFKHDGFKEENEWRIIYWPDRDAVGVLRSRIGYAMTN